ncbi:response regulator [Novosphingobium sp.]|uniref:response regulator n=1 Tax=Novosphingobium sp. TaxID=1874826 RepID=UPI003B52E958
MPTISSESPTDTTSAPNRLAETLPFLRRYARAATGSQTSGDALVRATLEAALEDPVTHEQISASPVGLFRAFTAMWSSVDPQADTSSEALAQLTVSQLARVPSFARQALLLNQLEDFTLGETAEILGVSEDEAGDLVNEALDDISREAPARVLIIEDEPLIASHLEDIVRQSGHEIVGNATTAGEARVLYDQHRPTLVLSDVQLADGSSGIDAVDAILRIETVPVIFITGFPQKFLTGGGHEPAFLITKPFREDTVKTTISQALFFGANLVE